MCIHRNTLQVIGEATCGFHGSIYVQNVLIGGRYIQQIDQVEATIIQTMDQNIVHLVFKWVCRKNNTDNNRTQEIT